jgi:hypothetical protein
MKRFLITIIVLLLASAMTYAQQARGTPNPTSAQVRQSAQQFLTQGRANSSQFESIFAELQAGRTSNVDSIAFNRLKFEIETLESMITAEENRLKATLDNGRNVSQELLDRVQRLINQHKSKLDELEAFIAN